MYAVKGGTSNSIDETRTFDALYLQPNDEGGGHFVHNIDTIQRNSACRFIGINKKSIPMTDLMVDLINSQAKREPAGVEFTNINNNTTVNNYQERGSDSNSDFEDDVKLYETSNVITLNKYHELTNNLDQQEEDQQEVNPNVSHINAVGISIACCVFTLEPFSSSGNK